MDKIKGKINKIKTWYKHEKCYEVQERYGVAVFGMCNGIHESCGDCKYNVNKKEV